MVQWDSVETLLESADYIRQGDRRSAFVDYLESVGEEETDYYLEHGSWRDKPARAPDTAIIRTRNNECYYCAQTGMSPALSYVEGYAVTDDGAVAHAWLETDENVVETSPSMLNYDTDYYGVSFDHDVVRDRMIETEVAGPVVEHV